MAGDDDLLKPEEIAALFQAAQNQERVGGPGGDDLSALEDRTPAEPLKSSPPRAANTPGPAPRSGGTAPVRDAGRSAEELLNQATADLARAVGSSTGSIRNIPAELGVPSPFSFDSFESISSSRKSTNDLELQNLADVELDLRIELGRTEMSIDEVLALRDGSVVALDKLAGDPVDILVNGRLVARGEVLVLNDNFCVRVAEILSPDV